MAEYCEVCCTSKHVSLCRDFFAIMGRGPRAFQIGKNSAVNP